MDFAAELAAEEAHTQQLARIPGWQDYIKEKARRMAKHYPALYGHLPALVADTINEGATQ
jgi:hypothetical protein